MAYITHCPVCGCTYRISEEDLRSCKGVLLCSVCQTRFDGWKGLREIDDRKLQELISPPPTRAEPIQAEPAQTVPPPAQERKAPELGAIRPRTNFSVPHPSSSSGALWFVGVLLLLPVFAWQLLSVFGPALSPNIGFVAKMRQSVCSRIPCPGPGSRGANPFAVDDFALKPSALDRYEISLSVVNNGTVPAMLPQLEITFTDAKDLVTVRKILSPSQYAGPRRDQPLKASERIPVRLTFSLAGERPASCTVRALPMP